MSPHFLGKSSLPLNFDQAELNERAETRKKIVQESLAQLRQFENIDVKVCGIEGFGLVPIDLNFDYIKDKPLWLIYESLNHMAAFLDQYDYFVNIEDDILLPLETLNNIFHFDHDSLVNEVLLPNRLEKSADGNFYCVDLLPIKGWTQQRKSFNNHMLQVAMTPHSGLLILSREKFRYALKHLDTSFRKVLLYNELDSAFAYFHSPFCLFRSVNLDYHNVLHLDKWYYSEGETHHHNRWRNILAGIRVADFVPPVLVKIYRRLFPFKA
jgi:hypothetical protein